jgi:uncharacterized protein
MPPGPKIVVFDCNVYVQALLNPRGIASSCLGLARNGTVNLYLSLALLNEVRDVLQRPTFTKLLTSLTPQLVDAFLDEIISFSFVVRKVPMRFHYDRDPKDEPYINLAIEIGAEFIVTSDKDLLSLMTGTTHECKEFRQRFRNIKVIEPISLLQIISDIKK